MTLPTSSGHTWRRCCRPRNHEPGGLITTIVPSSMVSNGSCVPALPGKTCPSATATTRRSPVASTAGGPPASGSASWPPCSNKPTRPVRWIGTSTSWIAPSFVPISTRPEQRGGPTNRSARSLAGRLQHQDPRPGRGPGQAGRLRPDRWGAARPEGAACPDETGSDQTSRSWATAAAPPAAGRRQGVQQQHRAGSAAAAWHWGGDSAQEERAAFAALRQGGVSRAEPGGTAVQPTQAVSPDRHSLRETRGELPCPAHHRCDSPLDLSLRIRPSRPSGS